MNKEIEIPEGYEARIEGNKVILERNESEDEQIRKEIIFILKNADSGEELTTLHSTKEMIAYLERQKEQKHSLNFDAISSWLRDNVRRYVNSEYNEFHHCTEYDGTINVERLIADLKVAVDGGTFDVDAAFDAREPKDNWEYIKEFCDKFGRIPKDMDELDELVSYVMVKKQKEQKPVEEWPNLSNCIKNCKKCHGKCFYRKEPYEEQKPASTVESKFKSGDRIQFNGFGRNEYTIQLVGNGYYVNSEGGRMDMSYTDANFVLVENAQKERGPLSKDEEYTLARIIEYLEDNDCPSEWKDLLHDVYSLPYQKEQEPIGDVIKNITKNKEAAIKFLKSAGIMDDNGELAEMYRSEQRPVPTAKEIWKEMRPEVYAEASGNRYNREQMYSDDSTKLFSIRDIDEIFEKIGNSTVGSQPAEWSEEDIKKIRLEEYTKGFNDAAFGGKLKEWNEEDKSTLEDAITAVDLMLTDSFQGSHPNLFKAFLIAKDWLKCLPERFNLQPKQEWDEEEKERIRQNGRLDVCYNPEKYGLCHKTEWGEGEMKMLVSIIDDYETAAKSFCGHDGKIMFLNAIRDGEYGLSKQEWSEEDKRKLNRIYGILGMAADTHAYSTTCRLIGDKEAVELQDFLRTIAKPLTSLGVSMARAKTWFKEHFNLLNNSSGRGEDYEIWTDEFDSIEEMYEDFRKAVEVTPNEA